MGAVTFSLDPQLVVSLQSKLPLRVLVETGTFKGDTVANLEPYFDELISIELSESLWADAVKRFKNHPHVQILKGNSIGKLGDLRSELQNSGVLYWLDAHWCVANNTAGERSQCPLLEELQAIDALNSESVVLIDDARLFLAPPLAPHEISQWPRFHQMVSHLCAMSSEHELMVVNDVIVFYPLSAKSAMEAYAQNCGIDWLAATNCLKDNGSFLRHLEEKERVIQQQESDLQQKERVIRQQEGDLQQKERVIRQQEGDLQEKEKVINEQVRAIQAYKSAYWFLRPISPLLRVIVRAVRRCIEMFRPRLGNLNQYLPRPLSIRYLATSAVQLRDTPKLSIITPSFQQGRYIERTIESVLDQNYPNLEYFVQDGGSTDDTVAVLKQYDHKLSGWVSESDTGQSQAINRGFSRTNGEIMGWLNSDDLLLPSALATVVHYFNCYPDVDVVYGNRLLIDENGMEIGRWIMPGHDGKVLSWADYVPQETMFWRRRIWEKAGGQIDESFRFAMDWDLLIRFREAGAKFAHIPRFLGAFRIHEHQKTSAAINEIGEKEMDRIREGVFARIPTRTEIRNAILPFLVKHITVDIVYRIKTKLGRRS